MKKRMKKLLTSISFIIVGCMCLTGCDWDDGIGMGDEIELEDRIDLSDRADNQMEGKTETQVDQTTEDMLTASTEVGIENDMQNVEQRDYATILMVSDGSGDEDYEFTLAIAEEKKVGEKSQTEKVVNFKVDDLEDLYEEYWSVKGKSLSLVHLKVIIMEKKDGQSFEYLWDFLEDMEESREIAKTCPVIQIADKEAFLKYVKDAKEPVGIYISDLIKINDENDKSIPKVKDYLKVMREGISLSIYYLEKEDEGWTLKCREEI